MADEPEVQLADRLVAAAGASVVAALIVNPLDVVKTRMQAQAAACSVNTVQTATPLFELHRRWLEPSVSRWVTRLPKRFARDTSSKPALVTNGGPLLSRRWAVASCPACEAELLSSEGPKPRHVQPSMWTTFRNIVQREGPAVLWRGSQTSLMISVPMVGIYMPLYDAMLAQWTPAIGAYAPMLAGSASRALAVFCVAPLELIRTRLYASRRGAPTSPLAAAATVTTSATTTIATEAASASVGGRVGSVVAAVRTAPLMWRGLSATLARDVPFSALYWGMLEPLRQRLLDPCSSPLFGAPRAAGGAAAGSGTATTTVPSAGSSAGTTGSTSSASASSGRGASGGPATAEDAAVHRQRLLVANLMAGAIAGGSAAGLTTPFDVIKTRHQIMEVGRREGVVETWRHVYRQEGVRGLFRGVGPRSARAAPACAIVIAVYELVKDTLSSRRALGRECASS